MKTTFWVAALFAIIFNLQSTALAADASNGAEVTDAHEDAPADDVTYEPDTKIDENAPADPPGEELFDPLMHQSLDPVPEPTEEENADQTADNDHEPESPEYHAYMEELSRVANEEAKKIEAKVPKNGTEVAEQSAENDSGLSPKTAVVEEGMDVHIEKEEEIDLPSIYPEINTDMTHVSYVNEKDSREVHLTVEYSFFKGADQYELCINCNVAKGKRADSSGQVKSFSKDDDYFCQLPPACFAEFIWKVGVHNFSMRAHTDKGWTIWSPAYHFKIESEVGLAVHLHNEL